MSKCVWYDVLPVINFQTSVGLSHTCQLPSLPDSRRVAAPPGCSGRSPSPAGTARMCRIETRSVRALSV